MRETTASSVQSYNATQQLMVADVDIDHQCYLIMARIHLKTKTTQFLGVDVYMGRIDDDLCPVFALLAYVMVRGMFLFHL